MLNMNENPSEQVDWSEAERTPEELEAAKELLEWGSPFMKKEKPDKPKPDKRILRKDHQKYLEILLGDPDEEKTPDGNTGPASDTAAPTLDPETRAGLAKLQADISFHRGIRKHRR